MAAQHPLTLMAVHAHPDDEASSTGGTLAQYADEGVRTVVVTCTNGELGDAPGGVKPGEEGHDEASVVRLRRAELEESCRILGVSHLETLGYRDSGMMGWPQNEAPGAFWSLDVEEAARPLVALLERYRPQVVVTYDANGFYGHPDHIQAHRVTVAAIEATGLVDKLYFPVVPYSVLPRFGEVLANAGIEPPEPAAEEEGPRFGTPDDEVSSVIDCSSVVGRKWDALGAHASQIEETFFLRIGRAAFESVFSREFFSCHLDRSGSPGAAAFSESDLFAGLRPPS